MTIRDRVRSYPESYRLIVTSILLRILDRLFLKKRKIVVVEYEFFAIDKNF